jgi:putative flippase GtrA
MPLNIARFQSTALQFTRFIATGVLNTLVGLGVIWLCWRVIGLPTVVSNLIGYCVGLCVSFMINRSWTFRSDRSTRAALPRFLMVFVASYLANLATLLVLVDGFHLRVEWATVVATVPYTLTFYFGSRWFVFHPPARLSR